MRRALAPVLAVLMLLVISIPSAAATLTVQRVWLGAFGANGKVHVVAYTNDTGMLYVALVGLRRSSVYYPTIWAGSCTAPTKKIVSYRTETSDASGTITKQVAFGSIMMNNIWYYGRPGVISMRYTSGASTICANLNYNHATRVRIPGYSIDLPVVAGPSGYPYCNVAMYQRILWQPTEPGVTFIFAHARTGMFLPLLTASKVDNGSAMIGKLVYVYTTDSKMYTYQIFKVWRHVTSIQSAVGITSEQLWLQTSEGPNFTYPKLIIEARRIATAPATYAASHPTPHIVYCT